MSETELALLMKDHFESSDIKVYLDDIPIILERSQVVLYGPQ